MQSSISTQIQTIQNQAVVMASSCHASGFAAIVYEPIAYYDDLEACSSIPALLVSIHHKARPS